MVHIQAFDNARDMWKALDKVHSRSTIRVKLALREKLMKFKFTAGYMRDHLNAILETGNQLKAMGAPVENSEMIAYLLRSLPSDYRGLITSQEGRDEENLTFDYVAGKVLDEQYRDLEQKTSKSSKEKNKDEESEMAINTSKRGGTKL